MSGKSGSERVLVTVTITKAQLRTLKRAAKAEGTTASGLVRVWVGDACESAMPEPAPDGTPTDGYSCPARVV